MARQVADNGLGSRFLFTDDLLDTFGDGRLSPPASHECEWLSYQESFLKTAAPTGKPGL
jgi:hypothetical protein